MANLKTNIYRVIFTLFCILIYASISYAQGPTGFTKLSSVPAPALTFVDSSLTTDNIVLEYAVTAVNANGESGPSNIITVTTPSTAGTHSCTLTWNASPGATSYNVYRLQVTTPPPSPTNLAGVVA
jgi:hypothetical protein